MNNTSESFIFEISNSLARPICQTVHIFLKTGNEKISILKMNRNCDRPTKMNRNDQRGDVNFPFLVFRMHHYQNIWGRIRQQKAALKKMDV